MTVRNNAAVASARPAYAFVAVVLAAVARAAGPSAVAAGLAAHVALVVAVGVAALASHARCAAAGIKARCGQNVSPSPSRL